MIYSMAVFIPWLVGTLVFGGYKSILKTISNEQLDNFFYAHQTAKRLNIDAADFVLLMACESRGISNAKGDYRNETDEFMAIGVYQFWLGTWNRYSKKYNWKGDYWNPKEQIELAAFMLHQDFNNWYHWKTCSEIIGVLPMGR